MAYFFMTGIEDRSEVNQQIYERWAGCEPASAEAGLVANSLPRHKEKIDHLVYFFILGIEDRSKIKTALAGCLLFLHI